MKNRLIAHIKSFPPSPGVYLMKDTKGIVIYVGKAKNLRVRVRQYFTGHDTRAQVAFLMKRVKAIDFLQTHTETEALLLENSLIKKHKPRYNVFLKDDKSYLGLKITLQEKYARLLTTRRILKDGSHYIGPFTSAENLRAVKEFIDIFFQLRTCSDHEFASRKRPCLEYQIKRCSAPCVNYVTQDDYKNQIDHVMLFLTGKSAALKKSVKEKMKKSASQEEFEEAARLRDLLQSMDMILRGQNVTKLNFDFVDVITIKRQDDKVGVAILMVRKSDLIDSRYYIQKSLEDNKDFLANFIVQYYTERSFIPKEIIIKESLTDTKSIEIILSERAQRKIKIKKIQKGDKNKLLKLAETNLKSHFAKDHANEEQRTALIERLKKKLHLQNLPKHIECYDVSNISGKFAVASLVTFTNAQKSSAHYRRFKIKTLETPNDYAMLKEVFKRRFSKKTSGWKKPDLIIVDGGKGQLKQIQAVFEEWSITDIDFVAIAKGTGEGARARGEWDNKKQEEIYLPNRTNPVILKPGTKELNLLQNIRDEAHRFAITYHRNLRDKALSQSFLDDIPGIGAKRKKELIKHFGSPERVVNASIEKLKEIKGLTPKIIKQLKALKISK